MTPNHIEAYLTYRISQIEEFKTFNSDDVFVNAINGITVIGVRKMSLSEKEAILEKIITKLGKKWKSNYRFYDDALILSCDDIELEYRIYALKQIIK